MGASVEAPQPTFIQEGFVEAYVLTSRPISRRNGWSLRFQRCRLRALFEIVFDMAAILCQSATPPTRRDEHKHLPHSKESNDNAANKQRAVHCCCCVTVCAVSRSCGNEHAMIGRRDVCPDERLDKILRVVRVNERIKPTHCRIVELF
jgi:hypothetical protein